MNVLMISPGFPDEMPLFTRGLAEVGARVYGIGDQPMQSLPDEVRRSLSGYLPVRRLGDETRVLAAVREWVHDHPIDRVECLWEPYMFLAARLREALGTPGLTMAQTEPFRDKETMKRTLDAAGLRTPHHYRAQDLDECREAAERIGFPLILKPIDGAGSADTYRVNDDTELEQALAALRHVPEVSVEEFIEGEEFTFDTITAHGEILFEHVSWYRPKPLVARQHEWMSPQAISLRDLTVPQIQAGRALGRDVIKALGFESGFTHMEWFLTADGEAVFGEIGGRSPGGRLVHVMNYQSDIDVFRGWAEAVCHGRFSQEHEKKYNAAVVFKRAQGQGRLQRYDGLESLLARYGEHIANVDLVPLGAPRRDWRQVVSGDGWLVARHPDLSTTMEIADHIGSDLTLVAG